MPALKPRCSLIPAILSFAVAAAQTTQPSRALDVPYLPTTEEAVKAMLQLANVKKTDIVYDLGCGDGRIVVAAAKNFGAHSVGIDIDPVRINEANENAKKAGVQNLGDLKETICSKPTFTKQPSSRCFCSPAST